MLFSLFWLAEKSFPSVTNFAEQNFGVQKDGGTHYFSDLATISSTIVEKFYQTSNTGFLDVFQKKLHPVSKEKKDDITLVIFF